jgi:hypothetical protein
MSLCQIFCCVLMLWGLQSPQLAWAQEEKDSGKTTQYDCPPKDDKFGSMASVVKKSDKYLLQGFAKYKKPSGHVTEIGGVLTPMSSLAEEELQSRNDSGAQPLANPEQALGGGMMNRLSALDQLNWSAGGAGTKTDFGADLSSDGKKWDKIIGKMTISIGTIWLMNHQQMGFGGPAPFQMGFAGNMENSSDENSYASATNSALNSEADAIVPTEQQATPSPQRRGDLVPKKPGDLVGPRRGENIGKKLVVTFLAILNESGNIQAIQYRKGSLPAQTLGVRSGDLDSGDPVFKRAKVYLQTFKKFSGCCINQGKNECNLRDNPELTKLILLPRSLDTTRPPDPSLPTGPSAR